jgi:hypothetical protein
MDAANQLENKQKQSDVESLRRLLYKYLSDVDSMMMTDDDDDEGHEKRDYSSSDDDDEVSEDMRISDHELANIDKFLKQNMPEFYLKELGHDHESYDSNSDASNFAKRDSSSSMNAAAAAAALSVKTNKKVRQNVVRMKRGFFREIKFFKFTLRPKWSNDFVACSTA